MDTASTMLPYVTIRHAGVSPAGFDRVSFDRTVALIDEILDLEACGLRDREAVCSALAAAIGAAPEWPPHVRLPLIALKRDIHNDRVPRALDDDPRAALRREWTAEEDARLQRWIDARARRVSLLARAGLVFAEELAAGRRQLRRLFRHRRFRKGIAVASPTLSRELVHYLDAASDADLRRIRRTEASLVRYYTRCAFKLTPFSTFTSSTLARVTTQPLSARHAPPRLRSVIKLNRAFVGQLSARVAVHPELRDEAPVAVAGSLTRLDRWLLVLRRTMEDTDRHVRLRIPNEAVVRIAVTDAIEWVLDLLARHDGALPRRVLVEAFTGAFTGATAAEPADAGAFVNRLIALGILTHGVPLPEDDASGIDAVIRFLASVPGSPVGRELRASLLRLEDLRERLAEAGYAERPAIIAAMEQLAGEAFACVSPDYRPDWTGLLFYEDCIADAPVAVTRPPGIEPALHDLEAFLATCGPLINDNAFHQRTMAAVLEESGGGPMPLLQFAEQWVRATAGGWQQAHHPLDQAALNPLALDDLHDLLTLRSELGAAIGASAGEAQVDLAEIAARRRWRQRARESSAARASAGPSWHTCYCQPAGPGPQGGGATLVVNSLASGPAGASAHVVGALASAHARAELADRLHRASARLDEGGEPCQLRATFDYNANLVAAVTWRGIAYGGPHEGGAEEPPESDGQMFGLGELEVAGERGRVVLRHRGSGARLTPIACGKMAPPLYPPLYRLLVLLGASADVGIRLFEPYLWRAADREAPRFETFPRLTFGACVLRRRGWSVPAETLPRAPARETPLQRFVRVRRWQRSLQLPDELFVRATSLLEWKEQALRRQDRQTWNRRKPQYICFRNYFLIDVLEALAAQARTRLYAEEMLPDRASWPIAGSKRPAEWVLDVGHAPRAAVIRGPGEESWQGPRTPRVRRTGSGYESSITTIARTTSCSTASAPPSRPRLVPPTSSATGSAAPTSSSD